MSWRAVALLAGAGLMLTGTAPAAEADPASTKVVGSNVWGIALSPGRVYYTRTPDQNGVYTLATRSLRGGVLGPEQSLGKTSEAALSASSGRLFYDKRERTYTGQVRTVHPQAGGAQEASGNRAVVQIRFGSPPWDYPALYDARTRAVHDNLPYTIGDLSGSFAVYTDRQLKSVRQRDLATGREVVLQAAGSSYQAAVAAHGQRWAAWVTLCRPQALCVQTLTILDRSTGKRYRVSTRGTTSLDMSGGYLAYDAIPGAPSTRQVRVVRLGTTTTGVVGLLPEDSFAGGIPDYFRSEPRHFDIDDETIGWIDRNHVGKVAQVGSFADAPFYLGNMIAPASFSPNGDGRGDRWVMAFPVSKALPSCTVTFYRGSTAVRIVSCANTNGMATAAWDGRSGSGKVLPKGRYTYRINGRDADGWLRHYNGVLTPVRSYVDKTA